MARIRTLKKTFWITKVFLKPKKHITLILSQKKPITNRVHSKTTLKLNPRPKYRFLLKLGLYDHVLFFTLSIIDLFNLKIIVMKSQIISQQNRRFLLVCALHYHYTVFKKYSITRHIC